jgi:gluconolactonase
MGAKGTQDTKMFKRTSKVLPFVLFVFFVPFVPPQRVPRAFELRSNSPKFNELIPADEAVEKIAGGFGFTEGPVWDPRGGFLFVNDESQNKISRVFPDGRVETVLEIRDPDGAAFDSEGRLIVCLSTLRKLIALAPDGQVTTLAETYDGKRLNSVNDVVLGRDGALYFTDPTIDLPKGDTQELPTAVYRLASSRPFTQRRADGSVTSIGAGAGALTQLATDVAQPNGLAFSPDGRHLYVTDTERREIRVYDVTYGPAGGLSNSRVFAKEEGTGGVPDGIKVDADGNVFATGPLGVWVWSPAGEHLGTIVLPETPANLAWGDASTDARDGSTLYFTARTSIYRLKTNTRGFVQK